MINVLTYDPAIQTLYTNCRVHRGFDAQHYTHVIYIISHSLHHTFLGDVSEILVMYRESNEQCLIDHPTLASCFYITYSFLSLIFKKMQCMYRFLAISWRATQCGMIRYHILTSSIQEHCCWTLYFAQPSISSPSPPPGITNNQRIQFISLLVYKMLGVLFWTCDSINNRVAEFWRFENILFKLKSSQESVFENILQNV